MKQVCVGAVFGVAALALLAGVVHAVYEVVGAERSRRERCSRPLVSSQAVEPTPLQEVRMASGEAPAGDEPPAVYVEDEIASTARRVIDGL